jgi:hypothetical protein
VSDRRVAAFDVCPELCKALQVVPRSRDEKSRRRAERDGGDAEFVLRVLEKKRESFGRPAATGPAPFCEEHG